LFSQIPKNLALPHRRYIREGLLTADIEGFKKKQYYFFLFNDIIVGSKKKGKLFVTTVSTYKYFTTIPITHKARLVKESKCILYIFNSSFTSITLTARATFTLVTEDFKQHIFTASSPQEHDDWASAIVELLRKLGSIVTAKLTFDPVEKIKEETRARRESLGEFDSNCLELNKLKGSSSSPHTPTQPHHQHTQSH
jgi:hypothetical protein